MHLTVRMAWHDNNWNGKVCFNPEGNTYYLGAHSLLSDRIEKKRKKMQLSPGIEISFQIIIIRYTKCHGKREVQAY
jgi:hypothetical protein